MVKDNDYEILYHPRKANVVVDTLSRKACSALIRGLCLRITIVPPLSDLVREDQARGIKGRIGKRKRSGARMAD